jgi:hypothetical protein
MSSPRKKERERKKRERKEGRKEEDRIEKERARHRWLTPVILATQEAEIRRVAVRSQPGSISKVPKTLS